MNSFAFYENKERGDKNFPIEYYYVDSMHPQYFMPMHWHMEYELIHVRSGSFNLSLDEQTIFLNEGDTALISEGEMHGGAPKNCVYECIVFDLERLLDTSALVKMYAKKLILGNYKLPKVYNDQEIFYPLYASLFDSAQKSGNELVVLGLLIQIFGEIVARGLVEEKASKNEKSVERIEQIKKVLQKIRTDYMRPLTLEELSDVAMLSPKYFCKAFSNITGKTPIEYLNFYRVESACEKLISTDESITNIAYLCGFNDLSYFVKTFKKHKGISPKQYRKQEI